jgi:hypothetical protein
VRHLLPLLLCLPAQAALVRPPADFAAIDAADWAAVTTSDSAGQAKQMQRDVRFMYATLFPDASRATLLEDSIKLANPNGVPLELTREATQKRTRFLGRLFLAMALGGMKYTLKEDDRNALLDWKWPLATALAHGQRVVFEFHGGYTDAALYDLLVNGATTLPRDTAGIANDPYGRTFSSHGISYETKAGATRVVEEKRSLLDPRQVSSSAWGENHGINLPVGGYGNVRLDGALVGPCGYAVDNRTHKVDTKSQHGHLLFYSRKTEKGPSGTGPERWTTGFLAGIEPTDIGCTSMFKTGHGVTSGAQDSTKDPSIFNGLKMKKLLPPDGPAASRGPAQYGGMWVVFPDTDAIDNLARLIANVEALPLAEQQEVFYTILGLDGPAANAEVLPFLTRSRR